MESTFILLGIGYAMLGLCWLYGRRVRANIRRQAAEIHAAHMARLLTFDDESDK